MSTTPAHPSNAVVGKASLLRFATAGSVDDGKSTLVGRLLHDAKAVLIDQLEAVARTSRERGFGLSAEQVQAGKTGQDAAVGGLDLALLTDGLRAEREAGITIDVAYRYFATPERTFILADCPGHTQYTKNTVTGASTADAIVLLIDARKGVLEQTRRHLSVAALLRVPHVVVAVNKMDLVDYSEAVFQPIAEQITALGASLGVHDITSIPVSALIGDNIVDQSEHTPWYKGQTLLHLLERMPSADQIAVADALVSAHGQAASDTANFRLPVQTVLRPQGALAPGLDASALRDFRAYAGQISEGTVHVGQQVQVLSPGKAVRTTAVSAIWVGPTDVKSARAPQSVAVELADDLDISRGDLVFAGEAPTPTKQAVLTLCWLAEQPLQAGVQVLVKHGTATVRALISSVDSVLDLTSLEQASATVLELNDIGRVQVKLAAALPLESYSQHRRSGALLIINPHDGNTLAAGWVE